MATASKWLQTLTIEERIALFRRLPDLVHNFSADEPIDRHLLVAAIFPKTLEFYGVTDGSILTRLPLQSGHELDGNPSCPWLDHFHSLYTRARNGVPAVVPLGYGICEGLAPIAEAAVGDVRHFLAQSQGGPHIDVARLVDGVRPSLYDRLFMACSRAMVVELGAASARGLLHGKTPKERFTFFVECLRNADFSRNLLEQYPVLIRQVVTIADDWRNSLFEFFGRLTMDWNDISTNLLGHDPGPLVGIQPSAGDSNNRGRTVILAEFKDHSKIVYKPRSLTVDCSFANFIDWVNARLPDLRLATCPVIDKGANGWSAFVAAKPCCTIAQAKEFYRRQGANLALLYLLGACDLHSENLIADGDMPKLIDLETLFHPSATSGLAAGATRKVLDLLDQSVLRTGLLPNRAKDLASEKDWIDLSGLGNAEAREFPFEVPVWEATNSDRIRLVHRRQTSTINENLPVVRGKRVGPEAHISEIVDGFAAVYRLLCDHRQELLAPNGPMHRFRDNIVRVVVRPTMRYALLLAESFRPELLIDALAREAFFDDLWDDTDENPLLARLMGAERYDMWRGDIPSFSTRTDSLDLWTSRGERIENALDISGFDAAMARIDQLGDEDLARQTELIRASLTVVEQVPRTPRAVPLGANAGGSPAPLQLARRIGVRLSELAVRDKFGASWVTYFPNKSGHLASLPAGSNLYDGLPGIALFLAHLGKVSHEARFFDLGRAATCELLATPGFDAQGQALGAFEGLGGVIYALTHLDTFFPDLDCVTRAEQLAGICQGSLSAANDVDVIGGLAGLVLCAISASKQTRRSLFADLAVDAGEALHQRVFKAGDAQHREMLRGRRWPLSFAHGRAGIIYALLKLHQHCGQMSFEAVAMELFEREVAKIVRAGPKTGESAVEHAPHLSSQLAWCHGRAGVALALNAAQHGASRKRAKEIVASIVSEIASSPFFSSDCLCHGNLGNVLIVGELNPGATPAISPLAAKALIRFSRHGVVCGNFGIESPGLMEGLAGIGLGLLKLAQPERIPNVLVLE